MLSQQYRLCSALIAALLVTGCGGGGGTSADASSSSSNSTSSTVGSSGSTSACPSSSVDDTWLDKRLACLTEGTSVIDVSSGATGTLSEFSFVVKQRVYDAGFRNVLAAGTDTGRYFSRILCIRNAPISLTDSAGRISLGTDLVVAVRAAGPLPSGYMIFFDLVSSGNGEPAWVEEPCDPARHPIIIDYATGKIETLTAASIGAVQVFDH